MTDVTIPAALKFARSGFHYIDQTGVTRGLYTGAAQTTSFGGDRVGAKLDFTLHGGPGTTGKSDRAQLLAFLMSLRGKQNRVYVADDSNTNRGSFPATELFSNYDFASGTTGWTSDSKYALTAADGVLRSTVLQSAANGYPAYQTPTFTQFAPYAVRMLVRGGKGTFSSLSPMLDNSVVTALTGGVGYGVISAVAQTTGAASGLFDGSSTGLIAGDYFDTLFGSCARCIPSDSGANMLLQSETFGTTWAASGASISSNTVVSPDGLTTGDALVENAANAQHYVEQSVTVSATALDYSYTVAINGGTRAWFALQLVENTGSTSATAYFNAGTGVVGSTPSSGANWANTRVAITSLGSSWYACTITSRKTNAATSLSVRICSATADNASLTFVGNSSTAGRLWRATLAQSGVATRLVSTTTTATTGTSQTGSALYVKGLPASTNGLLVAGTWVEIDGQLKMVQASLNSNAAGLGYLQFSPPLRRALTDNSPIIVSRPMGRFLFAGDSPGWDNEPGVISTASIELEEAFS